MELSDLQISNDDFIGELNEICRMSKELDTDAASGITPLLCIVAKERNGETARILCAIAISGEEFEEKKYKALESIGQMLWKEEHFPAALIFRTEAWVSSAMEDGKPKYDKPSEDPDRLEAVNVSGLTIDGRSAMTYAKIDQEDRSIGEFEEVMMGGTVNNILKHVYQGFMMAAAESLKDKIKSVAGKASDVGTRVGALLSTDIEAKTVQFLGYGTYVGDEVPTEAAGELASGLKEHSIPNPKIELDNGHVVYGCECWWGPEEEYIAKMKQYVDDGWTIEEVNMEEVRKEWGDKKFEEEMNDLMDDDPE